MQGVQHIVINNQQIRIPPGLSPSGQVVEQNRPVVRQ